MIRKFKKPIAYFMMATMLMGTTISCQRQNDSVVPGTVIEKQNKKLTVEQLNFLNELDEMIAFEITKAEKIEVNAKGNNAIDPSNPNNPYEYVGVEIIDAFNCAVPHMKEVISGDINDCPTKFNSECSKTGECVCNGVEVNLRSLIIKCTENVTGEVINPSDVPRIAELKAIDPIALIDNSTLSTFGKVVTKKYISTVSNFTNANAFVNVSKGFENKLNNSKLLNAIEKKMIISEISTAKYIMTIFNNEPQDSDLTDCALGVMGLVLGAAAGAATGGLALLGSAVAVASFASSAGACENLLA